MLYIIGLYHYPPVPGESDTRPQFVWVRLAGPFRKVDTANFALELERATHVREIDGLEWRAVYRMIVREAQLEWYGLGVNSIVPGQTSFLDMGDK
jgi:hypothetical protein